mmetsp:Transcript_40698/g.80392  ORF Transcript_40698/g.80392 Transcript_40698/m.80392 type:complete len:568 (+) Transcript_40698:119-1822(+)
MAPTRGGGERPAKEGAWVKKNGAGADKSAEYVDDDEERSGARGERGRGKGGRGRGGRRDGTERQNGQQLDSFQDGNGPEGGRRAIPQRGGKDGRAHRGPRGNMSQENTVDGSRQNANADEGGEGLGSNAVLNGLSSTLLKAIRYTKGELLSIARLPASQQKPPQLCSVIDKENKESPLLLRMAGGRVAGREDVIEDATAAEAVARKERRDRRDRRMKEGRLEEGAEHGEDEGVSNNELPQPPEGAASPPTTSARAATMPASNAPEMPGAPGSTKPARGEDEAATAESSLDRWFDRKKPDQAAGATLAEAATGVAPGNSSLTGGGSGVMGNSLLAAAAASNQVPTAGGNNPYLAALQQQGHTQAQAQAIGQAYAMQAATYMQAMALASRGSPGAAAMAAAGGAYGGSLPWGYNPYMFPYGHPCGGGGNAYSQHMDYGMASMAGQAQLEVAQAKLRAAQAALNMASGDRSAAGSSAAARQSAAAAAAAAAAAPSRAGPQAIGKGVAPKSSPSPRPAARAQPQVVPKTSPSPQPAALVQPQAALPVAKSPAAAPATAVAEDEDDAGCSQS